MRRSMAMGYGAARFKKDALAGVVVGIVALPLSMALAIAVGVPPQHGLYTAIVAGVVIALTGGSKHQVSGPTAAFIVILVPIASKFGLSGLLTAGLMAGVILFAMGAMRLGRFIEFIPFPVTTGFTAGIATVIATLQVKDVLGLPIAKMPDEYFGKLGALWGARGAVSVAEVGVAAATMALLLTWPRVSKTLPAPLVALAAVSVAVVVAGRFFPALQVATIGSRFHTMVGGHEVAGIPQVPPLPMLPWHDGGMTFGRVRELLSPALAIAMLGAIESLLSAVIADATTGKKHDPNAELVGLGLGNIVAPFFGGIAATGALARTATNVRAGATSPIAAVVHSLVVLAAVLVAAPLVAYVPMAALAALLLLVAWNMSDVRHFAHTVRVAPRSDVVVMLACFVMTVVFDMVVAIGVGVVLAALLFMKRMSEMTSSRLLAPLSQQDENRRLPEGVALYEIAGPLFFGAAQRAMQAIETVGGNARAVVLALGSVPVIDATGLVALESAIERLRVAKKLVVIAGPLPEPRRVFEKANFEVAHEHVFLADTLDEGIRLARDLTLLESVEHPLAAAAPPAGAIMSPDGHGARGSERDRGARAGVPRRRGGLRLESSASIAGSPRATHPPTSRRRTAARSSRAAARSARPTVARATPRATPATAATARPPTPAARPARCDVAGRLPSTATPAAPGRCSAGHARAALRPASTLSASRASPARSAATASSRRRAAPRANGRPRASRARGKRASVARAPACARPRARSAPTGRASRPAAPRASGAPPRPARSSARAERAPACASRAACSAPPVAWRRAARAAPGAPRNRARAARAPAGCAAAPARAARRSAPATACRPARPVCGARRCPAPTRRASAACARACAAPAPRSARARRCRRATRRAPGRRP